MNRSIAVQRLLVIHRQVNETGLLEKSLKLHFPSVHIARAPGVRQGIEKLERDRYDVVFAHYRPSKNSADILKELTKRDMDTPVVAIVDRGAEIMAAEAIKAGAYDYVVTGSDYSATLNRLLRDLQKKYLLKKDIAEKKKQHELLFRQITNSYRWWQGVIDAITDYLFVIDGNYNVLRTNKAFANLFNREPADIIMKPYFSLFGLDGPHDWCTALRNKTNPVPQPVETKIRDTIYLISSFPIVFDEQEAAVYIMKDITEIRRLKDQIYHLDKLSSLGTLSSGVAHEINNPLTGIIGYTEILGMHADDNTKKYLTKIHESAIRCKSIVQNMLVFSRQTTPHKSLENINDIIDNTIELHEYSLMKNNIEVTRNYDDVPYLSLDRQQMQQVILNLMINAEQAIAETKRRGRIEFRTGYDRKDKQVSISVSDNGIGIRQDIITKVFDPFFTTKPVNIGTGLGLSITHGIVTDQKGTIAVDSTVDSGTTFTISLPQLN